MMLSPETMMEAPAPFINADPKGSAPKLKFTGSDRFIRELRQRVDAYFTSTGHSRRDCAQMYFKTATILAWFFSAYLLLLLVVTNVWLVLLLAVVMGFAVAAIGFNIQHDGAHKAYSDRPWVNKLMSLSLDLMGGSSYMWNWKHNTFHHTFPNIDGHDDDISTGVLARLSPHQPRYKMHRAQGVYLWFLYGFLAIKWHFYDDFHNVIVGKIGPHKIRRPQGTDLLIFIGGKAVFFSMALVVPMLFHPWWAVLGVYTLAAFVSGVVLSVVFQLAHCVQEANFPAPQIMADGSLQMETDWAVHQVQTTVDFARRNPVLCWFLGGLNFQIEHHLLSRICHIHYPALSKIVEEVCQEFGVRYASHNTMWSAVASHARWLTIMGRPVRQGEPG